MPNSRLECENQTLLMIKMARIDTLLMTKTAEKPLPFGAAHTYISHVRDYPPPSPRSEKLCVDQKKSQMQCKYRALEESTT